MYRILDKRNRPLEFINPQGKDKLRNIYRFNSKNPLEFTSAGAAQAYLNKQFGEIAHLAGLAYDNPQEVPLRLWRKIKAIHYYLRIVSAEAPGIALPEPMVKELWISARAVINKIAILNTVERTVKIQGAPERDRTFAEADDARVWLTDLGYNYMADLEDR